MTYAIDVVGRIYSGQKSAYTYKAMAANPQEFTPQSVNRIARDFAQVDDFRVTCTTSTFEYPNELTTVHTVRREVVRDWAKKRSHNLFAECAA